MIYQSNEYNENNEPQLISNGMRIKPNENGNSSSDDELEYWNGFFVKKDGNRTGTAEAERHVLGVTNQAIDYRVLYEDCTRDYDALK